MLCFPSLRVTYEDLYGFLNQLQRGQIRNGVVSSIVNFGAFVDIGVHQDGLVHISALSHSFVKDPRDVVKTGETVKVRVLEVDVQRKRISLTMRLDEDARGNKPKQAANDGPQKRQHKPKPKTIRREQPQGAMAAALSQALKGK